MFPIHRTARGEEFHLPTLRPNGVRTIRHIQMSDRPLYQVQQEGRNSIPPCDARGSCGVSVTFSYLIGRQQEQQRERNSISLCDDRWEVRGILRDCRADDRDGDKQGRPARLASCIASLSQRCLSVALNSPLRSGQFSTGWISPKRSLSARVLIPPRE